MINIRSLDLNLLVAFDAIFDEMNVTRAADKLAVTQPTASGMLRRLRETFRDELFLRTSHGLIPTPRAEQIAGPIKELLRQANAIFSPAEFDPKTTVATFRLSASDYMQQAVVMPTIQRLRREAPKSRVSAAPRSATRLAEQLIRGEVDICVCAQETVLPDMSVEHLYSERYVCVGRREHPFEHDDLSLNQLLEYEHLLVDPTGRSFLGPVDHVLTQTGRTRQVAAALPTFSQMFDLLLASDYLAFVPERLVKAMEPRIKMFRTNLEIPEFDVVAMWHPRFDSDPRHIWLRHMVVDVAKSD